MPSYSLSENTTRVYAAEETRIISPNLNDFKAENAENAKSTDAKAMKSGKSEKFDFFLVLQPSRRSKRGRKQDKRIAGHNAAPSSGGVPLRQRKKPNPNPYNRKDEDPTEIARKQKTTKNDELKQIRLSTVPPVINVVDLGSQPAPLSPLLSANQTSNTASGISWGKQRPSVEVEKKIAEYEKKKVDLEAEILISGKEGKQHHFSAVERVIAELAKGNDLSPKLSEMEAKVVKHEEKNSRKKEKVIQQEATKKQKKQKKKKKAVELEDDVAPSPKKARVKSNGLYSNPVGWIDYMEEDSVFE